MRAISTELQKKVNYVKNIPKTTKKVETSYINEEVDDNSGTNIDIWSSVTNESNTYNSNSYNSPDWVQF